MLVSVGWVAGVADRGGTLRILVFSERLEAVIKQSVQGVPRYKMIVRSVHTIGAGYIAAPRSPCVVWLLLYKSILSIASVLASIVVTDVNQLKGIPEVGCSSRMDDGEPKKDGQ